KFRYTTHDAFSLALLHPRQALTHDAHVVAVPLVPEAVAIGVDPDQLHRGRFGLTGLEAIPCGFLFALEGDGGCRTAGGEECGSYHVAHVSQPPRTRARAPASLQTAPPHDPAPGARRPARPPCVRRRARRWPACGAWRGPPRARVRRA